MNSVNWVGTLNTVWAGLPGMLERRRGHVVIVSSGGGVRGFPGAAVYNGTKAAQRGVRRGAAPRAARHRRVGHDRVSGRDRDLAPRPRGGRMPAWYHRDRRSPPGPLGEAIAEAVEKDRRELFHPPVVRLLRIVNGISPRLGDVMLRGILGRAAAPRRH